MVTLLVTCSMGTPAEGRATRSGRRDCTQGARDRMADTLRQPPDCTTRSRRPPARAFRHGPAPTSAIAGVALRKLSTGVAFGQTGASIERATEGGLL